MSTISEINVTAIKQVRPPKSFRTSGWAYFIAKPHPIGFWLRLLAAACVLPAIFVASSLIYAGYIRERNATAENSIATARALMQVVDRELIRSQTAMQALATSPSLTNDDLTAFYDQAKQVLVASGSHSVVLSTPSGEQVLNTLAPVGTKLPGRNEVTALTRAIATGNPTISDLFSGSVSHRWMVNINLPVTRDGHLVYILAATLVPENFEDIFRNQNAPPDWTLTLMDRAAAVVARNRDGGRFIGVKPRQIQEKLQNGALEGSYETRTLDGIEALTAFSRSPISGWTFAISIPLADIDANLRRTLWLSIGGATTLLLLGLTASQDISLRISRTIRLLGPPAKALASGEPVVMPPVVISEVQEVGDALAAAARLLRQREISQAQVAATERQMAVSERVIARFSALIEGAPFALVVARQDRSITFINGKMTSMFGYDSATLLGKSVESLIADHSRPDFFAGREPFFAAPDARPASGGVTLVGRRQDSSEFPIEVSLSPIDFDGEPLIIAAVTDITERRIFEAEVAANHMRAMASARLSSLGAMAGGIAHEINNPLAIIHAIAEELQETADGGHDPSGEFGEAGRRISELTTRIARIIKSLLNLARDGRSDPLVVTALSDVAEKAVEVAHQAFITGAVSFIAAPIDPAVRIACREVEISQILLNLVQNAFEAATDQAAETGRPQWVRLDVTVDAGFALLAVTDSGKGVPPELETRIMEPFFTTKPVGKGTGLGLSLSRQVAEAHGGTIELRKSDGHTCFVLSLPLADLVQPRVV